VPLGLPSWTKIEGFPIAVGRTAVIRIVPVVRAGIVPIVPIPPRVPVAIETETRNKKTTTVVKPAKTPAVKHGTAVAASAAVSVRIGSGSQQSDRNRTDEEKCTFITSIPPLL
jgi:hypothetical protein